MVINVINIIDISPNISLLLPFFKCIGVGPSKKMAFSSFICLLLEGWFVIVELLILREGVGVYASKLLDVSLSRIDIVLIPVCLHGLGIFWGVIVLSKPVEKVGNMSELLQEQNTDSHKGAFKNYVDKMR